MSIIKKMRLKDSEVLEKSSKISDFKEIELKRSAEEIQ